MWSLLNGAIPTGWAECDGTANAPGPDLRNRFLVGRGVDHTVDTSGGAQTHTHAGHAAHVVTQPSDHTAIIAHTHVENAPTGQTGGQDSFTRDTSTTGSSATALSTGSSGSGTAMAHAGTAVDAHSAHDGPNHESKWYAAIWIQRMT